MIRRIWVAYRLELSKALRMKLAYAGPILALLIVVSMTQVHPVFQDSRTGYGFIADATAVTLNLFGLLVVLMYSAMLLASEFNSGVIRTIAVRPILRREYVIAKMLHGMTYAVLLTAVVGAGSWGVALASGSLTGVTFGGELIYANSEMAYTYLLGVAMGLLPQFAAVAYAVMISTLSRSPGSAIGVTVALWFVVDLVKYPLRIAPFLFSTYIEYPWQPFLDRADGLEARWFPQGYYCIGTSVAAFILFTAVAVIVMNRRNLQR